MGIYDGTKGLKNAFSSAKGYALCGYLSNPYDALSCQAIVPATNPEKYIPCTAVVLKNGTEAGDIQSGFNPDNIYIEKVADKDSKIDGFVMESETNIIEQGKLEPIAQGTVQIAKIGSGSITFLPCNEDLAGVPLSTQVYWNIESGELTKTNTADKTIALNITILGSVVKGQKRKSNAGAIEWASCNCIQVKL